MFQPCSFQAEEPLLVWGIYISRSKDIKHEVFVKYLCGYQPKEIAKESGIYFVTIYRWINDWEKDLVEPTIYVQY